MPKWEYMTVVRDDDSVLTAEQLNKLGDKGYELVAVVPLAREETLVGKTRLRHSVHYFFKRPKAAATK